ncbi:hypothetical protein BGZ60DRAFT_363882 [Tricladium varicosporioides]|nr:hypothetical protein BGZ60DRAFT_363882 [Hymenoscyphus varicosporioides]
MSPSHPSIQTFYKGDLPENKQDALPPKHSKLGDGFTEDELANTLDPLMRKWNPEREYEEFTIDQLNQGPKAVTFVGRVVNYSTFFGSTPKEPKAKGWHYLLVRDNTAAISVKIYFPHCPYPIRLGTLVTFWTAFISGPPKDLIPIPEVSVTANMFPGRVTSDHIMLHTGSSTDGICRIPLRFRKGLPLQGLMTLKSYLTSGHDGVSDAKILVCVKSIGAKKKIPSKMGGESELVDVLLFDHTGEVRLTLWREMADSPKEWQPGKTTLLISNPRYIIEYSGKGGVGVIRGTMIDVEPDFPDAEWLRRYAVNLTKKESLCMEFPEGVWDVEATEYGINRMFFTLAELDKWVRSDGQHIFSGFINVTIMELSFVTLHRRNMLMCAECCGIPTYSNTVTVLCRNCNRNLALTLNPNIIGTLLDETGCIAPGKLLWSKRAWEQLFGRSIAEIIKMDIEVAKYYEMRMLFMRLHLVVGWDGGETGRLCVLGCMQ